MPPEDIPIGELDLSVYAQVPILPAGKYKVEALRMLHMPAVIYMNHACHVLSVTPLNANNGLFSGVVIVTARRIEDGG